MKNIVRIFFVIIGIGIAVFSAYATDQVRTTEIQIADSASPVSTNQEYPFTLFIGDDLTDVTAPAMKSLTFTASGVYTGNGTITFKLDNDGGTSKIFTLPSVSAPTPFEIEYKDPSDKISPTSGGSYGYTLNFNPSGVTVYGLGIKMGETHRYKPPSCGGVPYGDLTSAVFDTGVADGASYNSILWKGTAGTGKAKFQFAASENSGGSWTYLGPACVGGAGDWFEPTAPDAPIELKGGTACQTAWNNKRYFRYKIRICLASNCTDTAGTSPVVNDVVVSWAP